MSRDPVRHAWLTVQHRAGLALDDGSDIVSLIPLEAAPSSVYAVELRCQGLVETDAGIEIASRHVFGIRFPNDYLRRSCDPAQVVTLIEPRNEWHPNAKWPFCCIGHIPPGMSLVSLVQQIYQLVTWQRYTPREDDALNRAACSWARRNTAALPVDPRRSLLRGRTGETSE